MSASSRPVTSVVVPAHQEEATVAACLRALLADAAPGEFDVVVVANGCTDRTAVRARVAADSLGHPVRVLDLPTPGKAAAIRAAEDLRLPLPRLYLDADVELPTAVARELVDALAAGADVAVPTRHLDLRAATAGARAYYRAWSGMPWVREQLAGRGVVAVGPRARAAFGAFPDVVADDRFLTTRVPRERAVVVPGRVTVRPPTRLRDVLRVRRRVYQGNRALAARAHGVGTAASAHDVSTSRRAGHLVALAGRPALWPGLVVFAAVTAAAKVPWPTTGWGRDAARGGVA